MSPMVLHPGGNAAPQEPTAHSRRESPGAEPLTARSEASRSSPMPLPP